MAWKMWIDCDAGTDDAQAILMALSHHDFEVVGISTVRGNTSCNQVTINVLRILKVAGRTDMPVYTGCQQSLLGNQENANFYHGMDGLGDVPDHEPVNIELIQPEHAVNALINRVKDSDGDITLVCMAPLTNIAMAIRLYPDLGQKLKACYIMGGNYQGRGNASMTAEFNFWADPEASQVVLNDLGAPITLACWELCLNHSLSLKWHKEVFSAVPTPKGRFIKAIESNVMAKYYTNKPLEEVEYEAADQLLMAIVLNPKIVEMSKWMYCTVELFGSETRGQMVCDWARHTKLPPNVTMVTAVNVDTLKDMMVEALQ